MNHSALRAWARRSSLISVLLRLVRARQMEHASRAVARRYALRSVRAGDEYSRDAVLRGVIARLAARGLPRPAGRRRVFWIGTDWDQDNSGFLAALRRWCDVVESRSADGRYGLRYTSTAGGHVLRDPALVAENDRVVEDQVAEALRAGPIDLLLGQMWANFVSADMLQRIRSQGIITLNIAMDDRLPEHWAVRDGVLLGSVGLGAGVDLVLTTSPECCAWYQIEGTAAVFFPLASDPDRFRPYPEAEKLYDVSFIGNKYGLRGKLVGGLNARGITVAAFGRGWPNGPVDADRSAEIFGRSRIILGVGNVGYSEKILTLKLRDFDATMSGALYVTHRNPDLEGLFAEGREVACYSNVDECARAIRYYLEHPVERMTIAAAAAARARREHTWDRRIGQLLAMVGLAN